MSILEVAREHRDQQSALIELLTLDLLALWRRVFGDRAATQDDVDDVAALAAPLVRQYGLAAGELARQFYQRQRAEAGIRDRFEVPFVEPAPVQQIEKITSWAINPGRPRGRPTPPRPPAVPGRAPQPRQPPPPDRRRPEPPPRQSPRQPPPRREPEPRQPPRQPAERRTPPRDPDTGLIDLDQLGERQRDDLAAGLARAARQPGRMTLEEAVRQDPRAVAYARITGARPCSFCAMLASRGYVYITAESASTRRGTGEKYHDRCQCQLVVTWRSQRGEVPEESQQWDDLWRRSGAKFYGKAAFAAFDRALRAQRAGEDVDAAVRAGFRNATPPRRGGREKNPAVPGPMPADDARRVLA